MSPKHLTQASVYRRARLGLIRFRGNFIMWIRINPNWCILSRPFLLTSRTVVCFYTPADLSNCCETTLKKERKAKRNEKELQTSTAEVKLFNVYPGMALERLKDRVAFLGVWLIWLSNIASKCPILAALWSRQDKRRARVRARGRGRGRRWHC